MSIETPSFHQYYAKTYRVDATADGGLTGHLLNLETGAFDQDDSRITEVLRAGSSSDISRLDEAEFIVETERARSWQLTGDGPIFALYDDIEALHELAKQERRAFTAPERARLAELRNRTFTLWEEEFARRAVGQAPTFDYRPRFPRAEGGT
ncbi:hypothetical protein [Amycolatopsis sp. H20-H5]|uniref:hypothetical protein n=1 Tax=Amycolatopsis sp. H20-H5 TaxID=3046309 RepID=UPI002DB8B719|nr:hypothetical protein [Amycolatopsis sp. H20-H5]MEC3974644.1 hypothetical protein [Amycolatopsis sp. H20-H5]